MSPIAQTLVLAALSAAAASAAPLVERLALPPGFAIAEYSTVVPNARSLALGARGTVFVGTRKEGVVYALVDSDRDGRAETRHVIARGLEMPNGIAFKDGALWVVTNDRILRFDAIEQRLSDPPAPVQVADDLPDEDHHGWRYAGFGPDGRLYYAIGAPCNVCDRDAEGFATIVRAGPDGRGREVVARGVRNSVGFDWHPRTGALWFTDNGRDWLGDDAPPDEINALARDPKGGAPHYGFPHCHGGTIADPDFAAGRPCTSFQPPKVALGAHVAPLGLRFYRGDGFGPEYRDAAFVAEHGSWNRTAKVGHRVMVLREREGKLRYEPFVTGFLDGQDALGRPVDLLQLPDGSLLLSDDKAGAVYRIIRTSR
jgi:glucose/arabinose dehydrogenase